MANIPEEYQYFYASSNAECHHAFLVQPLFELLNEVKAISPAKTRVLDLGCGNGSMSNVIAQNGYDVVGVEPSEQGVKIAQSNFPNCQFFQASINQFPYQNFSHQFDVVVAIEVIEHLVYPRELMRIAKQCLKPGGRLIISTPYHGYVKNLVLALTGKLDGHFTVLWDGGHIKFFSVETMTAMLISEGFADIRFKFTGRLPLFWKSMLCTSSPSLNGSTSKINS